MREGILYVLNLALERELTRRAVCHFKRVCNVMVLGGVVCFYAL